MNLTNNKQYKSYNLKSGWRSRGYLPHFNRAEVDQFVTFRLYDSLPADVIAKMETRLKLIPANKAAEHKFKYIQKIMDNSHGCCYLQRPEVAKNVQETLRHHNGKLYDLEAYVIMPNHLHLLLHTLKPHSLSTVIRKIKSYSATLANQTLNRSGKFWAKEYYDRYIRNLQHYENVKHYILNNPSKARLVDNPNDWPYTWQKK